MIRQSLSTNRARGSRRAALSKVAAAMARTFDPVEVLERGLKALIASTNAVCGEAYRTGPNGPELEVVRGCRGVCPFKERLERVAQSAARRAEPVREGSLIGLPVLGRRACTACSD